MGECDIFLFIFLSYYLIDVHDFCEVTPPKLKGVFKGQAGCLQEEAVLHPAPVLEVVGGGKRLVQFPHAWRK